MAKRKKTRTEIEPQLSLTPGHAEFRRGAAKFQVYHGREPVPHMEVMHAGLALAEFLQQAQPQTRVIVAAEINAVLGGVRVFDISFLRQRGKGVDGWSYRRSAETAAAQLVIFAAEQFLLTSGQEPVRPAGWETCINDHGEARVRLLKRLGFKDAAQRESRRIQQEERAAGKRKKGAE